MKDIMRATGNSKGLDTHDTNKDLVEKIFHLRCLAYLSGAKANLLTETISNMSKSKSVLTFEIKERKRVEENLRKSHNLYRQMFTNTSAVKALIDPETGDIVDANPAACKFYGYTRQELTSMKAWDINSLSEYECRRELALAEAETSAYFRFRHRIKSGEIRDVEVYLSPIDAGGKKLLHSIIHDITDRTRDREKLEESEEWFRAITASANDAIIVIDDDGKITYWNQAAERVFGHTSFEAQGQKLHDLVIAESIRDRYIQWYEKFKASGNKFYPEQTVIRKGVRKNGEEFPMELSVATVTIRDKYYAVGFVRDATERLRTQANLEKSLSLHHSTLESTADGILVVDQEGKATSFNNKFLLMWRIPKSVAETGSSHKMLELVVDQLKDAEGYIAKVEDLYSRPDEESFDLLEFKDGRIFERYSVPQKIDGKSVGRVWSFRDVTERKKMEGILHETLLEMNTILDSAEVGITFVKSRKINWANQKMMDLFGYSRSEVDGEPVEIYHTSLNSFTELRDEAFPVITSGKIHHDERLMKRKDGSSFWCRLLGKAIDTEDITKGSIWIAEDISERKIAEEKMRLNAEVFKNTTEGIMITDTNAVIRSVNPAFIRITGFSVDDAVGANPNILASGQHDKKFYKDYWNELLKKGEWRGVFWNRRKNGEIFPSESTITAIKDEQGNTTQYASIFRDITNRKRHEEQINYLAFHDPLTGLPNRQLFFDRIEVELARAKREKGRLAIIFIDLDHFKEVNDTMGHDVGDKLLQEVAQRLKECIRESDTVSRLGGDEFILLLPNMSGKPGVVKIVKKILSRTSAPLVIGSHNISVTASIGVSLYPKDGDGPESLVKKADDAMYAAKQDGRNKYKFY